MNGVMSWGMCDGWRVSRCETKDNVNLIVLFLYAHPRPLSAPVDSCDVSRHDVDDEVSRTSSGRTPLGSPDEVLNVKINNTDALTRSND